MDDWVKREEFASKEHSGTEELGKYFIADEIEVERCITKHRSHKAARANEIVNEFTKFGRGKGDTNNATTACSTRCERRRSRRESGGTG